MNKSGQGDIAHITNLLNTIDEVENYVVTDLEGRIHTSSSGDVSESTVNSCIYLWITGSSLGLEFKMGEPMNFVYNLKGRKKLIQRYGNYLFILDLMEKTKFQVFKKNLYQLLNREIQPNGKGGSL